MVKWWKDRDKVFRVPPQQPAGHQDRDVPEEDTLPGEDIGEIANDDFDQLDDVEPPDRSVDE